MQGVQVQSLVQELRSHMPCGQKTKAQNRSNIVTDSIKILKIVHIKKQKYTIKKQEKNEKTNCRMGENICKQYNQQLVNIKNIETALTNHYWESKQLSKKKWAEDLNRHFSKEDKQIAKRHIKRCSKFLITREMKIKISIRYHLTLVKMASIKKSTNNKCLWRCREMGTLLHRRGNVKWHNHNGKQYEVSLKN